MNSMRRQKSVPRRCKLASDGRKDCPETNRPRLVDRAVRKNTFVVITTSSRFGELAKRPADNLFARSIGIVELAVSKN